MPEPISTASVLVAVTLWAVDKGAAFIGSKVWSTLSKKDFKRQLDKALTSNEALVQVCDPPPTFDYSRLTKDIWIEFFDNVLKDDPESLGELLFEQQLIDLPWHNRAEPRPWRVIGECAAKVILEVIVQAVANDQSLATQFNVYASQQHFEALGPLQASLEAIRCDNARHTEQMQDHELVEESRHAELSSKLDEVIQLEKGNELRRLNDRTREILLENKLIELLDEKGKRIWQEVREQLRNWNYRRAHDLTKELQEWLDKEGRMASPEIRGRAYLLMTNLAFVDGNGSYTGETAVEPARKLYTRAVEEYGEEISQQEIVRLARCNAKLLAIEGDHVNAIKELEPFDDSETTLIHLCVLLEDGKHESACQLVRSKDFHQEWIHEAIVAFLLADQSGEAQSALDWARSNGSMRTIDRCSLNYAKTSLFLTTTEEDRVFPPPWLLTETQRKVLSLASRTLEPSVASIRSANRISTGVQADIIAVAHACYRTLGRFNEARSTIELLASWEPVHEAYMRAALRIDVPCTSELVDRIRRSYPEDCRLQLLAIDISWESGASVDEIASDLADLSRKEIDDPCKQNLCRFAFQLLTANEDLATQTKETLEALCSNDDIASACIEVLNHIRDGKVTEASARLREVDCPENVLVKQLLAEVHIRQGNFVEAVELLIGAGEDLVEPYCFSKASFYARKCGHTSTAIDCLNKCLQIDPDNRQALDELAVLRARLGDSLAASDLFARLAQLDPDQPRHLLYQAYCLRSAGEPDKAIEVLNPLCSPERFCLEAVCAKAQILCETDRAKEALKLLQQYKVSNWQQPHFVATFLQTAYSANCDQLGDEALSQLHLLEQSDSSVRNILQPYTIEDLVSMVGRHQAVLEEVETKLLQGNTPWLDLESLKRNPPVWGWTMRTQPLRWVADDRYGFANFTLYATNGYHVLQDENGAKQLLPIRCAEKTTHVVLDSTAVLTLHQLGVFEQALSFFEKIYLPSIYLNSVIADSARLLHHQPSQLKAYCEIIDLVKAGRLKVLDSTHNKADVQTIDEYADEGSDSHKLEDLDVLMQEIGLESKQSGSTSSKLLAEKSIVVEPTTLEMLAHEQRLDAYLSSIQLNVRKKDYQSIKNSITYWEDRSQVRKRYLELWEIAKASDRIEFCSPTFLAQGLDDGSDEQEHQATSSHRIAREAFELAKQLDLPLVVDDRYFQAVHLNANDQTHHSAFGTSQVLDALYEADLLTERQTALAYMQLIEWRYKFIVLTPEMLCVIYEHLGMPALEKVASYIHSCMGDIGLFSGPEPADPPIPMAFRVYQDWERNVVTFITSIWKDQSNSVEQATKLTDWALTELLPSIPQNLAGAASVLAALIPKTVMTLALFNIVSLNDFSRGHNCLISIANQLGITKDEYYRIALEVIGGDYD